MQIRESLARQRRRLVNVLAGGPRVTVLQVIGKSKEKIGKCSGGRVKGGRARQFCKSLVSLRRRLANVLAGVPRVADLQVIGESKEKIGKCSGGRVKADGLDSLWLKAIVFWRECQRWQQKER